MRRNLDAYKNQQVFLNYPFDQRFMSLADALSFAVVAGGPIPVCAQDLTTPDRPRLDMLVEAIRCCRYSAHDFSRSEGEGGRPSHEETREVMYTICGDCDWWDWRKNRNGNHEFPVVPIAFTAGTP